MLRYLLIAEDHPICASALTLAAQARDSAIVVHVCDTLRESQERLAGQKYDAMVLDLGLKDIRGVINITHIRGRHAMLPILVVSGNESPDLPEMVRAMGAQGFLPKSAGLGPMGDAIAQVMDGGTYFQSDIDGRGATLSQNNVDMLGKLSPAQLRVMRELATGHANKVIAYELGLAEATVKSHLSSIYRALGVTNRSQAILKVQELNRGLILS